MVASAVTATAADLDVDPMALAAEAGELVSASSTLPITAEARRKVAVFSNGTSFISQAYASDPEAQATMALVERLLNIRTRRRVLVKARVIEEIYATFGNRGTTAAVARDHREESDMVRLAMSLFEDGQRLRATDIHIAVDREGMRVWLRINRRRVSYDKLGHWSREDGLKFCRAVHGLGDFGDAEYDEQSYCERVIIKNLPAELVMVRCQFNPLGFDGRQLIMRLAEEDESIVGDFASLGWGETHCHMLEEAIEAPAGVILATGPTNSGKTTLLKVMLKRTIAQFGGDHIIYIGDPPEIFLPGLFPLQVADAKDDDDKDRKLKETIEAVLRSDPERICMNEVRLAASAEAVFQGARTGHGMSSTLHTNSAPEAYDRLMEIGVGERTLMNTRLLRLVTGQRLVGQLCQHCRQEAKAADFAAGLRSRLRQAVGESGIFVAGPGCDKCRNQGYGRLTVVGEVMRPSRAIARAAIDGDIELAMQVWMREGGIPMIRHGEDKVRNGLVDPRDLERAVDIIGAWSKE